MKKMMENMKRKIAAMLVVVLALQTVFVSAPLGLQTAQAGVKNRVELSTGKPSQAAFEELYVETGAVAGGDGDKLSLRFGFKLSDAWLEEKLYEYIDDGVLDDPGEFDSPKAYDAYLEGVDSVEPLAFTCTVNDGVLDVPEIQSYLEENRDIYTNRNEKIGTWEVENSANGPMFTITLDKKVYSRSNVTGSRGLEAQLLERYQPGDTVDAGKGTGGVDLNIRINGTGEPVATDSDYVMEKMEESGDEAINADGKKDPSAINFTIMARASASNAGREKTASVSGWAALASPGTAKVSRASVSELEDEIPFDERDGDLVFDWWNFSVPMKSRYVRTAAEGDPELDLTGKYVVDSISPDLNLDAVEITYDGLNWGRLDVKETTGYGSWEAYLADRGRMFSYEILSEDGGAVTEFGIRFYTRIADSLWTEYGEKGKLDREFPNKALLKDEDETTTLTVSNSVRPSVHWENMIEKDGVPLDVNGDTFQWKIHVDAHFSDGVNLYLIDHIEDPDHTHEYILNDPDNRPVQIESEGRPKKTFEIQTLDGEELGDIGDKKFGEFTIEDIESLLGKERFNDGIIYVYDQLDAGGARTGQYMLIPLTGYTNGASTITYDTDIRASKEPGSLEYEAKLANEVRPVWKWYGGLGPGEAPFGGITVNKEYPIRVNVVNKNAGGYHPESNTITWDFDVNQRGVNLDRVLIVDDLDHVTGGKKLEWAGLGEGRPITLIFTGRRPVTRSSAGDREVGYVSPETWNEYYNESVELDTPGDYYTVDGKTLKIHIGSMTAGDYYKFTVETKVLDGNYAANGKWTVQNTATVVATADGQNSEPIEIQASTEIEHSLISKYVEPFGDKAGNTYLYNYEDNTVQWRVKVNADGRKITNAVVTDTLPLGTTFDRVVSASRGSGNDSEDGAVSSDGRSISFGNGVVVSLAEEQAQKPYPKTNGGSYSADTVTFAFPEEIQEPFEFVFTTVVDENFRKEIVKSNGIAEEEGEPLHNAAVLDGKIDGVDITNARAEAVNRIHPQPLLKEGTYHGLSDYLYYDDENPEGRKVQAVWLGWTAYVNRTNADMAGVEIWDTLDDCLELVLGSVNIDVVKLDAEGTVADESAAVRIMEKGKPVSGKTPLTDWEADDGGFRFRIPEAYREDTLRITFDTVLVDDAAASLMVNTIHAKGDGWEDSSAQASDDNAEDFMLEDYATAEGMIFLRVLKSSENKDMGTLYLKGAEFSLQKMRLRPGGDKTQIGDWVPAGSSKTRTTRNNGALSYLFLQPDTMYCLKETKAPLGYKKEEKTWYIVARLENSSLKDYPGEATTGDMEVIINQERNTNSLTCEINNIPNVSAGGTNELRFVKTGQNGQILPGTKFTLKSDHMSWTVEADEKGVVSFPSLDPLEDGKYYTLKETKPVGYKRLPTYYVSVAVDQNGIYDLKLLDDKKQEITNQVDDPYSLESGNPIQIYEVKNTAIQNSGSFVKTDQNGDVLNSEAVTFEIYRKGDGGKEEAGDEGYTVVMDPAGADYLPYLPGHDGSPQTVTSNNGVVELKDLYFGHYKLVEKPPVSGGNILNPAEPTVVYIKVDGNGIKALPVGTANPEQAKDSAYGKKLDGGQNGNSLTVSNTLKWGFVQVNKVLGTYNGTSWVPEEKDGEKLPLSDVLFGIYRRNSDGSAGDLYMRVKTGADGRFLMDSSDRSRYQTFDGNGNPSGTKALLCGDYYLKEISVLKEPGKYAENNKNYPFAIAPGTGDGQETYQAGNTAYIDSEAETPEQAASDNENSYFLNKLTRQPVELVKVDADYSAVKLDHAQFHVFVKEGNTEFAVAELNSMGADGIYRLAPAATSGCETCLKGIREQNARGEKYLEKDSDTAQGENGTERYLLLPGSYIIRETKAPYLAEGDYLYPLDPDQMYAGLTVTTGNVSLTAGQGTLNPAGNGSGFTVKNRVKHGSAALTKYVMMLKESGKPSGEYQYGEASGFTFELSGTPAHAPSQALAPGAVQDATSATSAGIKTWTGTTKEDGTITFDKVPVGTYKLEEKDVPAAYKDPAGNWLIEKAPDIWVKIEPEAGSTAEDGVTVRYYADDNGKPGSELSACTGEPVPQNTSGAYLRPDGGAGAAVYNVLKLANVEGEKLALLGDSLPGKPLKGAVFTLTHNTLKNGDKPYVFNAVTDELGKLRFTNVPYGTYTLRETMVPSGFKAISDKEDFTITEEALDKTENPERGTYQLIDQDGNTLLRNQVIVANAKFRKVDQNGNAIPYSKLEAEFTVTKTNSAVDGEDFWPSDGRKVSTDERGDLELQGLSYGVYKIQETLTDAEWAKLDSEASLAAFWVEVKKASPETGKAEVLVYKEDPSTGIVRGFVNSLLRVNAPLASITVPYDGTADFTDTGRFAGVAAQMTNVLKHGGVQIHKVGGDAAGESGHEVTVDLEGVRFGICKRGENTPYLILETDENGRFPQMGPNGVYKDAETGDEKVLFAGDYILKEISTRGGYQRYTEPVDFTITDRSEMVFFGYDGNTASAKAIDVASGSDMKFYNIPDRGKLEFVKKDSETGKALDGAVFLAYADEDGTVPVAFIAQPVEGEIYQVIGNQSQVDSLKERFSDQVAGWQERLDGVAAVSGNEEDGYSLKAGDYYLKEIEAPENYRLPADESNQIKVTVKAGDTVTVQSGTVAGMPEEGVVANEVVKTELTFTKKIEQSAYRPGDVAGGRRFLLRGTNSNAVTEEGWASRTVSGEDGSFSFAEVPVGSYVLYEYDEAADTNTDPYLGFLPGVADEVAVLKVLVADEDGSAKVTYTKADGSPLDVNEAGTELTNKLKFGSVAGRKVSESNQEVGLKDAYIGIFRTREDAMNGNDPVAVVRSSDDGTFLFEHVPYGVYYVKEQTAPYGYAPAATIFKVAVTKASPDAVQAGIHVEADADATEMADIVFVNSSKRGSVRLEKKASPSDAALKDAVFTVYKKYSDGVLDVPVAYLTDQDGDGVYKLSDGEGLAGQETSLVPYLQKDGDGAYYLIQGHYWVAETTVPDGYLREMDGTGQKVYPVTLSGSGEGQLIPEVNITNDEAGTVFYNDLMTGGFTVKKTVEAAGPGQTGPGTVQAGEGFRFRIAGETKEAGANGTPISRIATLRIDGVRFEEAENAAADGDGIIVTTGSGGTVDISGLPIGVYTVTETDGPDMELYTGTDPREVTISLNDSQTELEVMFDGEDVDGQEAILSFHNELKRYRMEGKKTDEKGMPLSRAVFGLYSGDGQTLYHQAETDVEGMFAFEGLPTGVYVVKEISPSDDAYLRDDTEYPVEITGAMDPDEPVLVFDAPIINVLKRGFVEVEKIDPENRNHIFTGVQFTLYADDGVRIGDLKQEDGNRFVLASPSDGVFVQDGKGDDYLVWDDRAQRTALIYGGYYIQETDTEPGYLADIDGSGNPVKHAFSITEDGETVMISNNGSGTFENNRAKGSFEIRKEKEVIGENVFGDRMDLAPGAGFTFRVSYTDLTEAQAFADADIREFADVSGAASVVKGSGQERWIEVTTGADGRVVLSKLLAGQYTVAEVRRGNAADAYLMPSYQTVRVEEDQADNTVNADDLVFQNVMVRGSVEGLKVAPGDKPLAGAVIGLFPADVTEFSEENLFYGMSAVSGEDGKFLFERVPYGAYRVAELKAPSGYRLNEKTSYLVKVESQGVVVTAGIPEEKGVAAGTDPAPIKIENRRRSGGGGGGNGSDGPKPVDPTAPTNPGPGVPTEPVKPTDPTLPTEPTAPAGPSAPADPTGERPTIPFDPENPVINIPGDPPRVEIVDGDDNEVYEGPGHDINIGDWEPGEYTVYTFDDQDVPLGTMTFTIDDEGVPLAFLLPKTGDSALPYALLATIMLGALGGMGILVHRRRKERQS